MWIILLVVLIAILLIIFIAIILANRKNGEPHKKRNSLFVPANDREGIIGERKAIFFLKKLLKDDEYILNNLLLPLKNGHTTELDTVLITSKGLFCIETKNWIGRISGNDNDDYWLQEYADRRREPRKHKNPVKQNQNHCNILNWLLKRKYNIYNIVILVNLEDGRDIESEYTYTIKQFKDFYNELPNEELDALTRNTIYQQLLKYVATDEQLEQHKEELQRKSLDRFNKSSLITSSFPLMKTLF